MRRSWLRSFWAGLIVVGAIVGYLLATGLGERLLHDEIETQLSRLLQGPVEISEVKVRFEGGLRIEASALEAFPDELEGRVPAIRARRAVAWVDALALLIGRLELSTLVLEGPSLRVVQDAEGRFPELPIPTLELGPLDADEDTSSESVVARIEGLDEMAERLFESIRAADRIEILDGTIQWLRNRPADSDEPPVEIRLELFSSVIERNWLSEDLSLEWSAVVVDGQHAPFPIGAVVERESGTPDFDWTVTISQIPLEAAETPLSFIERIDGLSGQLTTALHLGNAADGSRRLSIDGQVHNAIVNLRRSQSKVRREVVTIHTEIEIGEKRLRLVDARLEGEKLAIDLKGYVNRPIRPDATARLESRMRGVELEDVFDLARSFENESEAALSFSRFVENVEGGRILYIEAAGRAPLKRWRGIVSGEVRRLPDGFVLGGAFENVRVATGPKDKIEQLRGEVEWVGDQLTLREASARFRDAALPEMDLVIDGFSRLADTDPQSRIVTTNPPPIPGLEALLELIKPRDPTALPPVQAIGLAIDHLEHPVFRYPFEDLRVLLEPKREGMDIQVRSGVWGGTSVTGEINWRSRLDPPKLSARLALAPVEDLEVRREPGLETESESPADEEASPIEPADDAAAPVRWGKGRFELEFRPRPNLPFKTAKGFFRLDDTEFVGNDVQFAVEPVGVIASRIVLDMAIADQVGVDLSFALTDGRLEHISEFIALPPTLATGQLGATGSLRGYVQPDVAFIAHLDGHIRAEAKDGRIRTEVPLLLRLSRASEGYNPFSNENEIKYEAMSAGIDFQRGSLLAEDFQIEGPLRIFARGRIDPLDDPSKVRGVVGIFLFRKPNQILDALPLFRYFLPGSERGLIGAYFDVKGALASPSVETLPVDTLMTVVPSAIKAPFRVLQFLFEPPDEDS